MAWRQRFGLGLLALLAPGLTPTGSEAVPRNRRGIARVAKAQASTIRQSTRAPGTTSPLPVTMPSHPCVDRTTVAAWPLARRSAQVLMIAVDMASPERARSFVADRLVGGILIRGTRPSLGTDLAALTLAADPPPILAADEEGGRAQRLRSLLGVMPSARVMAGTLTSAKVRSIARQHGLKMRAVGLTMNLAPDVDLTDSLDPSIGSRSFSANVLTTIEYASAFAEGMIEAGIYPVLKHFPGHGHATGDSHRLEPDTPALETLRGDDLKPFAEIPRRLDVGIMAGHLHVPGTDELPASVSSVLLTGLLRTELGFRGLIVTDALSMLPIRIRYPVGAAAVAALRAGADLLLFDEELDVAPIVNALSEAATADPMLADRLLDADMRILAIKGIPACDAPRPARR